MTQSLSQTNKLSSERVIVVSNDTHVGPRLVEDLREYCPLRYLDEFDRFANLNVSGKQKGTKATSEPGGYTLTIDLLTNVVDQKGTLTTSVDAHTYRQPGNGT